MEFGIMETKYYRLKNGKKIFSLVSQNKNNITLRCGEYVLHTTLDNVELVENINANALRGKCSVTITSCDVPREIMLRHQTKDEALHALDKYIDQAINAKLPQVKIIHGRHGHVLRDAVREYLDKHPYVDSYRYADTFDGSVGATVAIFKPTAKR